MKRLRVWLVRVLLRDRFAASALSGLIASFEEPYDRRSELAGLAYDFADAMLHERSAR